jgi:hypothetical protein
VVLHNRGQWRRLLQAHLTFSSLLLLTAHPPDIENRNDFLRRFFDANQNNHNLSKRYCGTSLIQSSKCRISVLRITSSWLSMGRDAMLVPDYVAIGVLIVMLVWAVADQFPRDKL